MASSKKPKKADDPGPQSHIGKRMGTVQESMKLHKSRKNHHKVISEMHQSVANLGSGQPPQGILKQAYEAGWKVAEESLSGNEKDDPAQSADVENPEEQIINVLRRGWPDPNREGAKILKKGPGDKGGSQGGDNIKTRNRINQNSPDVTV